MFLLADLTVAGKKLTVEQKSLFCPGILCFSFVVMAQVFFSFVVMAPPASILCVLNWAG